MEKNNVKKAVYEYVNLACKELDLWIVSMYETNYFVLMDSDSETPNDYTLEMLEEELKEFSSALVFDPEVKREAIENNCIYSEDDFL